MTNEEFDRALEAIRQGHITIREGPVLEAAVFMMRELLKIPEDQVWEPTHMQLVEFLNRLDKHLRRLLKRVADELEEESHTLH
jgi:hypothetical protein